MEDLKFEHEFDLGIKTIKRFDTSMFVKILVQVRKNGRVTFCGKLFFENKTSGDLSKPVCHGQIISTIEHALNKAPELDMLKFWRLNHLKVLCEDKKHELFSIMKRLKNNEE